MPSEKILKQKQELVDELTAKLSSACTGVLVDYKGISATNDTILRRELREAGVDYCVVKNTLLTFATEKAGLNELQPILKESTAVALSPDYTAAAKILSKYAEKNKGFKVKAGFVDGEVVDAGGVEKLAKLPAREVLVAQALGGLNAPITSFVSVLHANLRGFACVINAIAEQKGA